MDDMFRPKPSFQKIQEMRGEFTRAKK